MNREANRECPAASSTGECSLFAGFESISGHSLNKRAEVTLISNAGDRFDETAIAQWETDGGASPSAD